MEFIWKPDLGAEKSKNLPSLRSSLMMATKPVFQILLTQVCGYGTAPLPTTCKRQMKLTSFLTKPMAQPRLIGLTHKAKGQVRLPRMEDESNQIWCFSDYRSA